MYEEACRLIESCVFLKLPSRYYANYTKVSKSYSENQTFEVCSKLMNVWFRIKGGMSARCELKFDAEKTENSTEIYESLDANKGLGPKFNFDWIFLDEGLSDVKLLTASGKEIPAHKVVLAAASPVFKAMFVRRDTLENKCQSVDVVDVSHVAAVEMLRYIYRGSVETQEFSATAELLAAADKYQLEELRNKCENVLCANLTAENAIEALQIADAYNAKHLKKEAVDFIKRNVNESLDHDEISDMILGKARFNLKE
ncbi:hypothetical protein TKK_0008213 [Trichogramma kaykai]